MKSKQLTKEEEISSTRSLFVSSYDLASGGIPPHAHMLEQIVSGEPMDDYAKKTFLSLPYSNLLAIPGLTIYDIGEDDKAHAVAYFGQKTEKYISSEIKKFRQSVAEGGSALLRQHFYPQQPLRFEPLSVKEFLEIIEESDRKGYLSKRPRPFDEWIIKSPPTSLLGFVMRIHGDNGALNKEAWDVLLEEDNKWFSEPLYSKGIALHMQKLDIMNHLLRYATGKAKERGFADVNVFNPVAYFSESHDDDSRISRWKESFQKYFGKSFVPGAVGLLEWSEKVLADAREKYVINCKK